MEILCSESSKESFKITIVYKVGKTKRWNPAGQPRDMSGWERDEGGSSEQEEVCASMEA